MTIIYIAESSGRKKLTVERLKRLQFFLRSSAHGSDSTVVLFVCFMLSVMFQRTRRWRNKRHWDIFPSQKFSGMKKCVRERDGKRENEQAERERERENGDSHRLDLFTKIIIYLVIEQEEDEGRSLKEERNVFKTLQKEREREWMSRWERDREFKTSLCFFKWDLFCFFSSSSFFSQFFFKKRFFISLRISLSLLAPKIVVGVGWAIDGV